MIKSLMGSNNVRLSNDDNDQLSLKTKRIVTLFTDYIRENTKHLKGFWISHVNFCSQRRFNAAVSVSDLLVVHIYDGALEPYLLRFKSQLACQSIVTHPMFRRHFFY